jgi:hypothetical protein
VQQVRCRIWSPSPFHSLEEDMDIAHARKIVNRAHSESLGSEVAHGPDDVGDALTEVAAAAAAALHRERERRKRLEVQARDLRYRVARLALEMATAQVEMLARHVVELDRRTRHRSAGSPAAPARRREPRIKTAEQVELRLLRRRRTTSQWIDSLTDWSRVPASWHGWMRPLLDGPRHISQIDTHNVNLTRMIRAGWLERPARAVYALSAEAAQRLRAEVE